MKRYLLSLLLLLPLAAPAAVSLEKHSMAIQRVSQASDSGLDEAVARVQKEQGGRILSAETVQENGRQVHVIKVLTPNNSVRTLRIDADNGR
jgi:uncharacterized membrane protein YkoI